MSLLNGLFFLNSKALQPFLTKQLLQPLNHLNCPFLCFFPTLQYCFCDYCGQNSIQYSKCIFIIYLYKGIEILGVLFSVSFLIIPSIKFAFFSLSQHLHGALYHNPKISCEELNSSQVTHALDWEKTEICKENKQWNASSPMKT